MFASDSIELFGVASLAPEDKRLTIPSGLFASTHSTGKAGDLRISTRRLSIGGGARASASTLNAGQGGTLDVTASDAIELFGTSLDGRFISGLFADARSGTSGQGGDLKITTGQLIVRDGAQASVSSKGSGNAGNLEIAARSIQLNNQGKLNAETASGNGGNITLSLQDLLLMRHNSSISTTAGTAGAGGDGGNINITAPLIIAVPSENSDVTANAFTGRGGRVEVTAQGIFGTQFRQELTAESDITASSTFGISGVVEINTPDVDPSRGLVALPTNLVDPSGQIAQGCSPRGTQTASSFVSTGRGGLPPSPTEALSSEVVLADWVTVDEERANISQNVDFVNPQTNEIVEAQGWVVDAKGKVTLVASVPNATPQSPNFNSPNCQM